MISTYGTATGRGAMTAPQDNLTIIHGLSFKSLAVLLLSIFILGWFHLSTYFIIYRPKDACTTSKLYRNRRQYAT
jgi:hypothetical protein